MQRKGKKENLNLKYVTIIDPATGQFEITQYENKCVISIANLVETMCLDRYTRPKENVYEQG